MQFWAFNHCSIFETALINSQLNKLNSQLNKWFNLQVKYILQLNMMQAVDLCKHWRNDHDALLFN